MRDVQVHVHGLPPAPKGGYYELWMQDGSSEPTGLVAFDTSDDRQRGGEHHHPQGHAVDEVLGHARAR